MTEGELYDHLQHTFGVGDFDEALSKLPWWRFRALEISKLKGMLKKRRATVEQVYTAAVYADAKGIPITATYQLFALIPDATADKRNRAKAAVQDDLTTAIEVAIAEALDEGNHEWADRLMRCSPSETTTVINEWRSR